MRTHRVLLAFGGVCVADEDGERGESFGAERSRTCRAVAQHRVEGAAALRQTQLVRGAQAVTLKSTKTSRQHRCRPRFRPEL